MVLDHI
jgi:hypothetical protein